MNDVQDERSRQELESAAKELNVEIPEGQSDDDLRAAVLAAEEARDAGSGDDAPPANDPAPAGGEDAPPADPPAGPAA